MDTSYLPDGWAAHLLYDGSEYQAFPMTLDSFVSGTFNLVMDTGTVGSGRAVVNIYSQGGLIETPNSAPIRLKAKIRLISWISWIGRTGDSPLSPPRINWSTMWAWISIPYIGIMPALL